MKRPHATYFKFFFTLIVGIFLYFSAMADETSIYFISSPQHASITFMRKQIPKNLLPEVHHLPNSKFLDVSIGEEPYFRNIKNGLWDGIRALVLVRPRIIRLLPFDDEPKDRFLDKSVLKIKTNSDSVLDMLKFIDKDFVRMGLETPVLDTNSEKSWYFYNASGNYHLFSTCLNWITEVMAAGHLQVSTDHSLFPEDTFNELKATSEVQSDRYIK